MGFRFRRSVKILPGVRLNFSKSGVSTSVGTRGAHVTIGHGQVRETVGIPGTGISCTEVHRTKTGAAQQLPAPPLPEAERGAIRRQLFAAAVLIFVFELLVQAFTALTSH